MSKASRLRKRQRRRARPRPPCSVCGRRARWKRTTVGKPEEWVYYCKTHSPKREILCAHKRRCWKTCRWSTGKDETLKYWCNRHVPRVKPKPTYEWVMLTPQQIQERFGSEIEAGIMKMVSEELAAEIDRMVLEGLVDVKPMTDTIDGLKFYQPRYNTGNTEG